jgi:hypothetical protein
MCRPSRNPGASTFWNPQGLSRPVMGLLYLLLNGTSLPTVRMCDYVTLTAGYHNRGWWWISFYKTEITWKTITDPWFQASAAMLMRSALFWDITQRRVVIPYRRLGTTYRSHLQGSRSPSRIASSRNSWPFKMEPIRRTETSVKDNHSTLRNTSEECRSNNNKCLEGKH